MSAIDKMLMRGFELMMSNEPDSTEQLRELLYDSLVQKYGAGVKPPPLPEDCYPEAISSGKPRSTDEMSGQLSDSPESRSPYQSPLPLHLSDDSSQASADIEDNSGMNFSEFSCIICGLFSVGVCNQLMECNSCQNLYHQDCHNPPIKEVARSHWECSDCLGTKQSKVKSSMDGKSIASGSSSTVSTMKSDHKSLHKSSSSGKLPHKPSVKTSSGHSSSSHSSHSHRSHHSSRHGHSSSSSGSKRHSSSSSSMHKSSSHSHHHHKSSSSRESKQYD